MWFRRGHLMELPTSEDRTLFFDSMPILMRQNGIKLKLRVFTVPGQVLHNSTRRVVLQGADAVAFVADSQPARTPRAGCQARRRKLYSPLERGNMAASSP